MGVHKLIQVNGLGTLLHETPSGTMVAAIVLPASSEEHSADISESSGKSISQYGSGNEFCRTEKNGLKKSERLKLIRQSH